MIEHIQICDACGSRAATTIETFEELEAFAKAMMGRVAETKGRGEFKAKEKMFSICPECWEHRRGNQ
jgi:hypothetical protein